MRSVTLASGVAAVLIAAAVLAQGPPGRGPMPPPGSPGAGPGGDQVGLLTDLLQLSDAQQAGWRESRTEADATVAALAEQVRALQTEVRRALESGSTDVAAIGAKMISAHGLEGNLKAAHDASRAALKSLLTPEQAAKLAIFDTIQELMRARPPIGQAGPR